MEESGTQSAQNYAESRADVGEVEQRGIAWRLTHSPFNPIEHEEDILARAYAFILSWSDTEDETASDDSSS